MKINIRIATIGDLSQLAILNSFGTEERRIEAEEKLPAFINTNNLIVAEIDGEIVGLLYWERKFLRENDWFLTQITVAEDHRRKGIGEKLLRYFLDYAKKNNVASVFLDISKDNIASTNLAKKLNAIVVGEIDLGNGDKRNFYRFDLK